MSSNFYKLFFNLLFACIFAFIMPVFGQGEFVFSGKRKKEVLSFKKSRGLIILPMYINNKGPFNFVLDTGVGSVIITNPSLKDSLNLQYLRKIEINGLGEQEKIIAYSTPFLDLKIGNAMFKSATVVVLADDVFNLSGYAGLPIDGLIGHDFFNSFLVQVNYESNVLKISKKRTSKLLKKGTKIPIEIKEKKPYLNATVKTDQGEKLPLNLLIDTGSGHPIVLETYGNKSFPLPEKFVIANLGVGLAGNIRGFNGRIKELKLGKFSFDDIVASFPYYEDVASKVTNNSRNGSLGNPIFRRFNVLFDYEHKSIYLKRLANYKMPFEYDMSGMELVAVGDNYDRYLVTRVERQSAADEFGIIAGDEILSVNFKPVNQLSLEEIIKMFSSKDDRTLFLEISRGENDGFAGVLTLKKRI
ncbi:aspartyl protease family protein [Pedobacter alpinus]|uniref:Aspartyl protease family protein n=1 Tax=Pedobacter alpinus TaxID=1590643 RepID=A0ABW5TVP7_9SPHI